MFVTVAFWVVFALSAALSGKELGEAIERADLSRIRQLISAGADLNTEGPNGETPLSFALRKERLDAAKLLLELGADPSRGQNAGRASLFEMSMTDKLSDVLETALKHGANPNFVGGFGLPILQSAIGSRATRNVELIVAAGARLEIRDGENDVSAPLAFALQRRLWTMAQFLVEHGAPLNEPLGNSNLDRAFQIGELPDEGGFGSEEYLLLAQAMAERGFHAPKMRSGTRREP